ncbi:MAG: hypothetical protein HY435_01585 [Candidatus Liptonbacteria bacterium]|nr:hypothetical protein [Candidatus Liptonbacteria bacterium]
MLCKKSDPVEGKRTVAIYAPHDQSNVLFHVHTACVQLFANLVKSLDV